LTKARTSTIIVVVLVLVILVVGATVYVLSDKPPDCPPIALPSFSAAEAFSETLSSSPCDPSLWAHVYDPSRLRMLDSCVTATGTVGFIHPAPDGDVHICLKLDKGEERLLNQKNIDHANGYLVVEVVCVGPVILQSSALDACRGYKNNVQIPQSGWHVTVTGSWVQDTDHGWNEIHPASSISRD
jgi:hypothetical protein